MYKELVFVCCVISLILISTTEAKGGRSGGGRSSGRSSSRGSRGGLFSSSASSKSGNIFSGGWFHGFIQNTPYHYTYRPTRIVHSSSSSSSNTGYYHTATQEEEAEQEKENSGYVIGYSINKALSSDFFSILNVVHDVSKYPEKIRNKEVLTTTTHSPVVPYDSKYKVNPSYTKTSTIYGLDSKSYFSDGVTIFNRAYSKKALGNNDEVEEMFGNFEKVFESRKSTPKKIEKESYSPDDGSLFSWMQNGFGNNESIQKKPDEVQSSIAINNLQV